MFSWYTHYSTRGATVPAVATIHVPVIYPVFGYSLLSSLIVTCTMEEGKEPVNLFGERLGFSSLGACVCVERIEFLGRERERERMVPMNSGN